MSVSVIVTDFMMLYCTRKRNLYKKITRLKIKDHLIDENATEIDVSSPSYDHPAIRI